MGYRSQIHFTIVGKRDDVITELVTFKLKEADANMALNLCCFINNEDLLAIKFYGDDWKWYGGYEKVDALMALYGHFEQAGAAFSGAFVCVGDDLDDVVTKCFGNEPYDLEQVHRTVESMYQYDPSKLGFVVPESK